VEEVLAREGPNDVYVAATDFMRALPEMIDRWIPGRLFPLGTDGFGRSETRAALRRHFEVDAQSIALAALYQLSRKGVLNGSTVQQAVQKLGIDPDKVSPMRA
jgi:pyruvate dehydrogenase E1 component